MLAMPASGATGRPGIGLDSLVSQGRLSVFQAGEGDCDLAALLDELASDGHESVLVEGGGDVLAAFLDADLIDEMYVTICPCLIGGRSAPTPVEGAGWTLNRRRRMELVDLERAGDELFLHYQVQR